MKKTQILLSIPVLAALALALLGCQLNGEPAGEEQVDAEVVAWAITDPASGLSQEVADLGSYLFGVDGSIQGPAPADPTADTKAPSLTASYALYCSGAWGGFVWNPDTRAYEKELFDVDISLPCREIHLDRLFVQVRFYITPDASGDPYQPPSFDGGLDPAVQSLTYHREVDGSAVHLTTGTESDFDAVSDLVYTDIDRENKSVVIAGTHDRSFERLFENGRMASGAVSYTIRDLEVAYDGETSTFTYSGEIDYVYDAAVTRSDGTIVTRHREATITFDGTVTFFVQVGKLRLRYHLLTGALLG